VAGDAVLGDEAALIEFGTSRARTGAC